MKKYKLSKHICIESLDENIPARYQAGYFILYDAAHDDEYLINETIKYFIDKFSTPKSREEVIAEVASDVNTTPQQVEPTCHSFIDYLRQKKFLLQEEEAEAVAPKETLYKRGNNINQYIVDTLLDNKDTIEIYLATDPAHDRQCVIKLLNRNKFPNPEKYQKEWGRLQREYDLLQKANDAPAICKVYAFEEDKQGNAYIVQEFIRGNPITHFVKEVKNLTKQDYWLLLKNLLAAFAQLHECGLVHADVHASNVLVARDKTVRIIDLGLTVRKEEIDENKILKFGGADYYMPPERINISSADKFANPPDFFSDVYQIGLLMYATLYHHLPFKGFIWEELAKAIKEDEAPLPDVAAAGFPIPQYLKNIVRKCLEKDPTKRYATAAEILKEYVQYAFEEKNLQLTNA